MTDRRCSRNRAMGKDYWDKFEFNVWLTDPELSLCKPATRGIWIDAICRMLQLDRCGQLQGLVADLARVCRCSPNEMRSALDDLKSRNAADIAECDGVVTLQNRRMRREWTDRKSNSDRQKRVRGGGVAQDVAPNVAQQSKSNESESEIPKRIAGGEVEIPAVLCTPVFLTAWEHWESHRREKHSKLTPTTIRQQFAKCVEWGPAFAAQAIMHSIEQGWLGLFPPKGKSPPPKRTTTKEDVQQTRERKQLEEARVRERQEHQEMVNEIERLGVDEQERLRQHVLDSPRDSRAVTERLKKANWRHYDGDGQMLLRLMRAVHVNNAVVA